MEQPDKITADQNLEGFQESLAAGEAAAVEGANQDWGAKRERIPEKYQNIFRDLARKVALRDQFARIEEVKKATERRFYWRSMMDVVWNEGNSVWETPYNGQLRDSKDVGDVELHYPVNIFQAFGRGFISIVGQVPRLRMEATKINNPDAQRVATAAETMKENIEAKNDMEDLSMDVARLMWTDGRVGFYSRWVTDGARFGYEDEEHSEESNEGIGQGSQPPKKGPRKPRGGELLTPYGVLESKVPMTAMKQADMDFRSLAFEISMSSAKAMYPDIAKKIKGGTPGPGEYNFDRTSRIACTQGIRILTEAGAADALPTWSRIWFRPSFFSEIENNQDRGWFIDNYPDGAMVAFIGDTYAESRNESMDDHWDDIRPLPGDGQATPAAGEIIVPIQDMVCDLTDLKMERAMKSIPAIWCRKDAVNLQAISKQKAGPGAHFPTNDMEPTAKVEDAFWPEPAPEIPADEQAFWDAVFGPIPQFLTGLYPASMGESDPNNDTLGGIKLLGQASRGQAGVAWRAFRKGYAKAMAKLIRIGAYFRAAEAENGIIKLATPSGDEVEIDLEDLHSGNWACVPDGDESYPTTHADKQEAYNRFVAMAGKSPQAQAILFNPKNLVLAKDLNGLADLEIPGADSEEKQMDEIKQLLAETPIPNLQAIQQFKVLTAQAQLQGAPPPPQPPMEAMLLPSVAIDEEFDDHGSELEACKDWINSAEGQQAKRNDKDGFLNVRLHALAHKAAMQKQQMAAAAQQVQMLAATEKAKQSAKPAKTPAESINFKDLGPSGKMQVAAQAGLDIHADVAAQLAGEAMGEHEEKPDQKPNGKVQ